MRAVFGFIKSGPSLHARRHVHSQFWRFTDQVVRGEAGDDDYTSRLVDFRLQEHKIQPFGAFPRAFGPK